MTADNRVFIQEVIARFANSFDMKDWSGLEDCFTESLYTDYSDLRGTPPNGHRRGLCGGAARIPESSEVTSSGKQLRN